VTTGGLDRPTAALVAADRWSLWRTFTRGLVHHLANAAQMLAIDPPPPGARAEASERIGLVQDTLADAHRESAPGPTLVPDVLRDVQAMQRLQSGFPSTELQIGTAPGVPAVGMTAADLRHVLLALVTNAKHAAAGERALIRISTRAVADDLELTVEDGGPGLPPGLHERAFEPFVTTRADGALGLGLTVARALAQRAGGVLDHEPGTSRFRLRLPAWRRPR
jgi:C4-dicarboxylate-specific signal transduction histidine kinase